MEALYPDEAATLAEHWEALEYGYELHYDWIAHSIYDKGDTLSAEECSEVIKILDMHRALKRLYEALTDKAGISLSCNSRSAFRSALEDLRGERACW